MYKHEQINVLRLTEQNNQLLIVTKQLNITVTINMFMTEVENVK